MESEQHHYELRSRSRSRSQTPMVMSRSLLEEATEHHYDLRSRSRERSHTPGEVTSSRRSGSRSAPGSSTKTHDKSLEIIEESKEGSVTGSVTDNQSTKSESSNVTVRKERRSERQKAKRQLLVNGQNESKGDKSDQTAEQKQKSVTPSRVLTSDYSSEEGEREEQSSKPLSAYEIYKRAGEWWNVFPKTDYTYSHASRCRYEIAPGILAMPNMSRRSIHSDTDSSAEISNQALSQTVQRTTGGKASDIDTVDARDATLVHSSENIYDMPSSSTARSTVHRRTHVEQYSSYRKVMYSEPSYSEFWPRFLSSPNSPKVAERYGAFSADSDAELDENFKSSAPSAAVADKTWRIVRWFTYVTTFIAHWFRKTIEFFKFGRDKKSQYYSASRASYNEQSKWSAFWRSLDHYTHNIYFFFVRILILDAWLLSQFTGVRKWLQEKFPKILLVTLLPLFLLFGTYIAQEHFFTCVDFLRNVQANVTETAYHIFNNITNLISLTYELITQYFVNLKNYLVHLLPSVNVPLPEMPPIGWNIKW